MAKGLVSDTNLTAIANAIRAKNGSSDTYTPATMATAITNIPASQVDQESALKWMLENRSNYDGIAAGLVDLTSLPTFTQPSGITKFSHAFDGCSALTSVSNVDFSSLGSGSDVDYMFNQCSSLTGIIDVRNAGKGGPNMFNGCSGITKAYFVKTNSSQCSGYDYTNMFRGCTNLTKFGNYASSKQNIINWINCNYASYAFSKCPITSVTINALGTTTLTGRTKGVNTQNMFNDCSALKTVTIGSGALINLVDARNMFTYCRALETISSWSMPDLLYASQMFYMCGSLTQTSLDNILGAFITATAYAGTKTLKDIGLTSTQATTCTGLSNWSALSAAGWTTGY